MFAFPPSSILHGQDNGFLKSENPGCNRGRFEPECGLREPHSSSLVLHCQIGIVSLRVSNSLSWNQGGGGEVVEHIGLGNTYNHGFESHPPLQSLRGVVGHEASPADL